MTVALEPALDQGAELVGERRVEEVVNTKTTPARLGRVRWSDSALRRADGRPAKLDLLEAVNDLVEVENKVGTVGEEEATFAVKTWVTHASSGQGTS